ncbi:MAG: hypothetical protein JWQ97_1780 [Phenylobacterium sp.]|nr:hypothetical protein [Phenylobacterium sp.]
MNPPAKAAARALRRPRRLPRALAGLSLGLALAGAAMAAPTCWDGTGHTVRCEAPGALPVGTTLSPEQELAREPGVPLPPPEALFSLVCIVGGLFVLIGLMPDFDGWNPGESERRSRRR